MSLPDGAEYWWDVRGHNRPPDPAKARGGQRMCPECLKCCVTIKKAKKHWAEAHADLPLPLDFPMRRELLPQG